MNQESKEFIKLNKHKKAQSSQMSSTFPTGELAKHLLSGTKRGNKCVFMQQVSPSKCSIGPSVGQVQGWC